MARDKKAIAAAWWQTEKGRELWRHRNFLRKLNALCAYGGSCARCGFSDIRALQIDHVRGDGAEHRREIGRANIYAWLAKHNYPQDGRFQVLCANCNWIKRAENGEVRNG